MDRAGIGSARGAAADGSARSGAGRGRGSGPERRRPVAVAPASFARPVASSGVALVGRSGVVDDEQLAGIERIVPGNGLASRGGAGLFVHLPAKLVERGASPHFSPGVCRQPVEQLMVATAGLDVLHRLLWARDHAHQLVQATFWFIFALAAINIL